MQRRFLKFLAVVAAVSLVGCTGFPFPFGSNPPGTTQSKDTTPTAPPTAATAAPDTDPTLPPAPTPQGALKAAALGFLVSNNAAGLSGKVAGPSALVSNNAAGLVSNNAAGLVSNNAAGLVSNNAAGYRVSALAEVGVKDGFVYLTSPDERFWVNSENKLIGTLSDKDGNFSLPKAPSELDLIVNVMLTDNRRLTALVNTEASKSATVTVNLASTLATEFLRAKASEFGFALKDVVSNADTAASWAKIVSLTGTFLDKPYATIDFKPADLAVNNIPVLRQRYAVLLGTGTDQSLSDEWVNLLRLLKKPTSLPDWVARPLAVTSIDTEGKIPPGDRVMGVAVAPDGVPNKGNLYISHVNDNQSRLTEIPADGSEPRRLLDKPAIGHDSWAAPATLVALPSGKIVMMDTKSQWIALVDPLPGTSPAVTDGGSGGGYLGWPENDTSLWLNPTMLLDVYTAAGDTANYTSVDDVTFSDDASPSMFFVDLSRSTVREVPNGLEAGPFATALIVAGKQDGLFSGTEVPAATSDVVFNQPSKLTYHRQGDNRWLYVSDNGDHIIVRINLGTGTVEHVVGELPPPPGGVGPRKALCYGDLAAEKGLFGIKARDAHLRFPHKMLFDKGGRMILADSDNRLIRIATVYENTPLIWTLAGSPLQTNSLCQAVGVPPPFSFQDGEARHVSLGEVNGMAFDPDGNLILSDVRTNRVRKIWTSFIK